MGDYDRSSKWLIQHHGDALLRLAGLPCVASWRPLQAEVVQPAQLPDGLIEAQTEPGGPEHPYLLEIATYPEERLRTQLVRGALLVLLDRGVLPDVVTIALRPKGRLETPSEAVFESASGWAELRIRWRVVELWTVPAEQLLATGDPGLMPWVSLCAFGGPPEPVIRRCREVIERAPDETERENLLAVAQVLARLRYNDPGLLNLLGGYRTMIESPIFEELREWWQEQVREKATAEGRAVGVAEGRVEGRAETLLEILRERLGEVPEEIESRIRRVSDADRLEALVKHAVRSDSVEAFASHLEG